MLIDNYYHKSCCSFVRHNLPFFDVVTVDVDVFTVWIHHFTVWIRHFTAGFEVKWQRQISHNDNSEAWLCIIALLLE